MPADIRLFVAAYPPAGHVEAMQRALRDLDLPPHRVTPAEQVHLTVQFIGDTPRKDLDDAIESVERSASGIDRFTLVPEALITLPPAGRARLVALETDAPPALLELHRRLATRFARSTRSNASDRFLAHLTLCRFRAPIAGFELLEPVEVQPFDVDRIALVRSDLSPQGAVHREVVSVTLGG